MPFTLRPLVFKLHLYLAVAVAVYVAIMGVTGAIMAFRPEITRLAHSKMAYVPPAPPYMSVADLVAAVEKTGPGQPVTGYVRAEEPDGADIVFVGKDADFTVLSVNPYTAEILGKLSDDRIDNVLRAVTSLHQRLTPPRAGARATQVFMTWVTVAALFLTVSGVYLWWPRMRFGIAGRGRPFWYDLHATLGIAAAFFIVLLTVSGVIMGFAPTLRPMIYALTGSQPAPEPKRPPRPAEGTEAIPIGRAFEIGAAALPGATPLQIITRPGLYVVFARVQGERLPSEAFVDQYTGVVVGVQPAGGAPAGTRLIALNRSIHGAEILGLPGKIALALASLILALQVVSGAVMWIKRAPFRSMIPALVAAAAVTAIAVYTVLVPTS